MKLSANISNQKILGTKLPGSDTFPLLALLLSGVFVLHCSDFLPGAGPLLHLSTPTASRDVRIDTGVRQSKYETLFLSFVALKGR